MIYVFYSDLSYANENYDFKNFCEERRTYLSSITDNLRFKQSYYVWKLLLRALGIVGEKDVVLSQNDGKWYIPNGKFNFSLSHSKNLICVSISEKLNAVDVEMFSSKILRLKKKFCKNTDDISELTSFWTEKECLIKENSCKTYKHFLLADALGNNYDLCVGLKDNNENIVLRYIENL